MNPSTESASGAENRLTPLEVLQEIYQGLGQRDRELLQQSLFLGLLTDPLKTEAGQGDFLVRNIVGLDSKKGHLAVGALLRRGSHPAARHDERRHSRMGGTPHGEALRAAEESGLNPEHITKG